MIAALQPDSPQKVIEVLQSGRSRHFEMHPVHRQVSSLYQEMEEQSFLWFARLAYLLCLDCHLALLTGLKMLEHNFLLKLPIAEATATCRDLFCRTAFCHML